MPRGAGFSNLQQAVGLWSQEVLPHETAGSISDLGIRSADTMIGTLDDQQFRFDSRVLQTLV